MPRDYAPSSLPLQPPGQIQLYTLNPANETLAVSRQRKVCRSSNGNGSRGVFTRRYVTWRASAAIMTTGGLLRARKQSSGWRVASVEASNPLRACVFVCVVDSRANLIKISNLRKAKQREHLEKKPWNLWGIAQSISFPRLDIPIAASGTVAKICGGFLFHRLAGILEIVSANVAMGDEFLGYREFFSIQ